MATDDLIPHMWSQIVDDNGNVVAYIEGTGSPWVPPDIPLIPNWVLQAAVVPLPPLYLTPAGSGAIYSAATSNPGALAGAQPIFELEFTVPCNSPNSSGQIMNAIVQSWLLANGTDFPYGAGLGQTNCLGIATGAFAEASGIALSMGATTNFP